MSLPSIRALTENDLSGRRVFVRVDFNVPLDGERVVDDTRLRAARPTLLHLAERGARVVLASHCGRPKGAPDPRYSLRPVAAALEPIVGRPVGFVEACVGAVAEEAVERLEPGGCLLLENLRFDPGEKANAPDFADALSRLGELYVDDAFGTAHRAHASVVGVPQRLPRRYAGLLLEREVVALGRLLSGAERPFAAILGGAKIEGKIDTLMNLLDHVDLVLVGGGMANTFLAAGGLELGRSLVEGERLALAREILSTAEAKGVRVLLPVDLVVTDDLSAPTVVDTVAVSDVGAERMAVDVGPASVETFAATLGEARTIFWNGPLGVFERPPFDAGTRRLAECLGGLDAYTVVGGGETVAAVNQAGIADRLGHVSTGGGASLDLLAGKVLPGVAVLEENA